MTPETLEIAARKLCELHGIDHFRPRCGRRFNTEQWSRLTGNGILIDVAIAYAERKSPNGNKVSSDV